MILTLKKDGKMITLYSRKMTVAKAIDENDVQETVEWLKDLTEEVFEKKDQIEPNFSRGVELKALDIYKLLPGTNCKVCDELTCLAFAVKILSGGTSVVRCGPLFTPEHRDKRQVLLELLQAAGYSVPGIYL
jgi:ArsR family metal-binding transcriptional regulator